jgi:hypothetical protein
MVKVRFTVGNAPAQARKYLEALQFASSGGLPHRYEFDEWTIRYLVEKSVAAHYPGAAESERTELIDRAVETQRRAFTALPTPYENPQTYFLLTHLVDGIEETARLLGWALPPRPLLGTLATGQMNAVTVRVPGTAVTPWSTSSWAMNTGT